MKRKVTRPRQALSPRSGDRLQLGLRRLTKRLQLALAQARALDRGERGEIGAAVSKWELFAIVAWFVLFVGVVVWTAVMVVEHRSGRRRFWR